MMKCFVLLIALSTYLLAVNGKAVEINVTDASQSSLFNAIDAANVVPLAYDVVIKIRLLSLGWVLIDTGLPPITRPMTIDGCGGSVLGISGMGISGNGITISTSYTTNNTEEINIRCLNIKGFDVGIASDTFVKWAYINVFGTTITDTVYNAMNLTGHPATVDECTIVGNQGNGIWFGTTILGSPYTISNTVVKNNGLDGISINNCGDRVTITNCSVISNGGDGIQLLGPSYAELVIAGCDISGNGNYGIKMDEVMDAEIYDNYIGKCGQREDSEGNMNTAINVTNLYAQLNVSWNIIGGNHGDGVYARDIFQTFIANNTIGCVLNGEIMGNDDIGVHTSANYMQQIDENIIQGHGGAGIKVLKFGGYPLGSISRNSITLNGDGIEIVYNKALPVPVLSSAISATSNTTITGTVSPVGIDGIILEFFCNGEESPDQGREYIGTITTHKQSFTAVFPTTSCYSITATATMSTRSGTWVCSPFSKYVESVGGSLVIN